MPSDRDYDCFELRSWGIVNIPIRDTTIFVGEDWMLLDDDHDGIGCEVEPVNDSNVVQTAQTALAVVPTPEPPDPCDGLVGNLGCFLFGP